MSAPAIVVKTATKHFGAFKAVDGLSFEVPTATCFGLLGPNGAGKTTMMNMLTGRIRRDDEPATVIDVMGYDPRDSALEIKYLTGIVPQENNLDVELSVIQNLMIYSKFYGIRRQEVPARIEDLLAFMEMTEKKNARIKELSGGMQRRLVIARALLNAPKMLILDEPTTGLDPQVRQVIWDKLRLLKQSGVTILITTHYMDEAYQLCDELIIMNQGREVLRGNPARLIRSRMEAYVLEILTPELFTGIGCNGLRCEKTDSRIMLYADEMAPLEAVGRKLEAGAYFLRPANLEDLFLKVTGRRLND